MSEAAELTFGGWLKQQRKQKSIGPDDLSEQVGCSTITLLKIEAGERRPSRQLALLLADFFRIPADEREAFVTFARFGQAQSAREGPSPARSGSGETVAHAQAPWRTVRLRQTNLPTPLTPLVGRAHEQSMLADLLAQPRPRLLTLTGAPGIGKTRLALEVVSTLVDHFDDGVFLVELAPVTDPELVIPAIAHALNVREIGSQTVDALLLKYLADKRMLLVLDNFEQVLDAATDVAVLLQASPWLKVLVTSREALHVRGEKQFPLLPLGLPDPSHLPTLDMLARNPSVRLLVEHASAINPNFSLTITNAEDIAVICVSLDGLPLAIELAASAVSFSPGKARQALSHRLHTLEESEGARDLPPRQRTLRKAIEWSFELLDESERTLLRRLSVFVGGFTLEAAEAIGDHDSDLPLAVREGVESLTGKSLIQRESKSGQLRFGMLETIREFASDKLEQSGETEETRGRHALYFMQLAEEAEPNLRGGHQLEWLNRLTDEYENLLAGLHWASATFERSNTQHSALSTQHSAHPAEVGLRIAGAIARFWHLRGYFREGREQCAIALESSSSLESLEEYRAKVLNGAGALAYEQGDHEAAGSYWTETLALRRKIGDPRGIANSLNNLGLIAHDRGDLTSARSLYEESLAVKREIGDKVGLAQSLNNLGVLVYDQGDSELARRLWEESVVIKQELGDKAGMAATLNNLGSTAREQRDYAAARSFHEQSLSIRRELGDQTGIAQVLERLGTVALEEGDYATAHALYVESLTILSKTASTVHIQQGDHDDGPLAAAKHTAGQDFSGPPPRRGKRWESSPSLMFSGSMKQGQSQPVPS